MFRVSTRAVVFGCGEMETAPFRRSHLRKAALPCTERVAPWQRVIMMVMGELTFASDRTVSKRSSIITSAGGQACAFVFTLARKTPTPLAQHSGPFWRAINLVRLEKSVRGRAGFRRTALCRCYRERMKSKHCGCGGRVEESREQKCRRTRTRSF